MRPLGIVLAVLGMTVGFRGAYVFGEVSRERDTTLGMLPRSGTNNNRGFEER